MVELLFLAITVILLIILIVCFSGILFSSDWF